MAGRELHEVPEIAVKVREDGHRSVLHGLRLADEGDAAFPVERMVALEHYRDFVLEDGPLKEWASRMASLDVARETANPDQYYIDLYTRYAREKATA